MEHLEIVHLPRYKVQGWEIEPSHKHSLWCYKISIFLHNTYHNLMIHYVFVCLLIVYLSICIWRKSFFLFTAISSEASTVPSQNKASINMWSKWMDNSTPIFHQQARFSKNCSLLLRMRKWHRLGEIWMTDRFIYCIHFINSKTISWEPMIYQAFKISSKFMCGFKKILRWFKTKERNIEEIYSLQNRRSKLMHPGMWRDFTKITCSTIIAHVGKKDESYRLP